MSKKELILVVVFSLMYDDLKRMGYIKSNGDFDTDRIKEDNSFSMEWLRIRRVYEYVRDKAAKISRHKRAKAAKELDRAIAGVGADGEYILLLVAISIAEDFELYLDKIFDALLIKTVANLSSDLTQMFKAEHGLEVVKNSLYMAKGIKEFISDGKVVDVKAKKAYIKSKLRVGADSE